MGGDETGEIVLDLEVIVVDGRGAVAIQVDALNLGGPAEDPGAGGDQFTVVVLFDEIVVQVDDELQLDPLVVDDGGGCLGIVVVAYDTIGEREEPLYRPADIAVAVGVLHVEAGGAAGTGGDVLHGGEDPFALGDVEDLNGIGAGGHLHRLRATEGIPTGHGGGGSGVAIPPFPAFYFMEGGTDAEGFEVVGEHDNR